MRTWGRRVAVLAAVVVLAAGATACGSGDDDDSATDASVPAGDDGGSDEATGDPDAAPDGSETSDLDPCSLLSAEDLSSVTGLPFGPGVADDSLSGASMAVCDWTSDDPFATAQVLIQAGGDVESQRRSVEDAFGEETLDLDLGDGAYQTLEGSIVGMAVGGDFVQVSYIPPGPGDVTTETRSLAEIVLANLG